MDDCCLSPVGHTFSVGSRTLTPVGMTRTSGPFSQGSAALVHSKGWCHHRVAHKPLRLFQGEWFLYHLVIDFHPVYVMMFALLWHHEPELCILLIYPRVVATDLVQTWCCSVHATEAIPVTPVPWRIDYSSVVFCLMSFQLNCISLFNGARKPHICSLWSLKQ